MDIIQHKGGQPANFLDIGGGASAEKVSAALRIILEDPQVKTILINIFGGMTRCDEVAAGIRKVLDDIETTIPIVIRLVGTNKATADTLQEAAEKAVVLSLESNS